MRPDVGTGVTARQPHGATSITSEESTFNLFSSGKTGVWFDVATSGTVQIIGTGAITQIASKAVGGLPLLAHPLGLPVYETNNNVMGRSAFVGLGDFNNLGLEFA